LDLLPVDVSSNTHSDEALISVAVRKLCNQLRTNDPSILNTYDDPFVPPPNWLGDCSEAECIAIFQALKENVSVKHIGFDMLFKQNYTEACAVVAAEYVESSKTLQTLDLDVYRSQYSHEVREMVSLLLQALSRNTLVSKLTITTNVVRFASVAFQELLTRTLTLQKLQTNGCGNEGFNEMQIATIASGFANNTTLRDVEFKNWREADLAPVLTALQNHPALQKMNLKLTHFTDVSADIPSSSGLEALLHSQDSKVTELVLEGVATARYASTY
jgi:hypothetical protein